MATNHVFIFAAHVLSYCLVSGFFLAEIMKNTYFDLKENQLVQTASLLLKAIEMDGTGLSR